MSSEVVAGFDAATGMFSLSWWLAAAVAAFLVACVVLAVARTGLATVLIVAAASVAIVFILGTAWNWASRPATPDRPVRRDALFERAFDLAARAVTPGSALSCLDGMAGELVELSCEKALFASPEGIAAATSYVAARIALLASGADPARITHAPNDAALPGLRASLEEDRFGFVAQVLVAGYGCTADKCDALSLFRDAARVRANLRERPFDTIVARNMAAWSTRAPGPAVVAGPATSRTGPSPVPPGFNVPSAASIPPVSIMTPEGPPPSASSPPVAANDTASPPSRRPAVRTAPSRPAAAAPPVQLGPPPSAAGDAAPRTQ